MKHHQEQNLCEKPLQRMVDSRLVPQKCNIATILESKRIITIIVLHNLKTFQKCGDFSDFRCHM